MKCSACQCEVPDNATFCPACGEKVSQPKAAAEDGGKFKGILGAGALGIVAFILAFCNQIALLAIMLAFTAFYLKDKLATNYTMSALVLRVLYSIVTAVVNLVVGWINGFHNSLTRWFDIYQNWFKELNIVFNGVIDLALDLFYLVIIFAFVKAIINIVKGQKIKIPFIGGKIEKIMEK